MPRVWSLGQVLSTVLFSLALASCGFHLRGYTREPLANSLKEIQLQCSNSETWQLCQKLREHLQLHHVVEATSAAFVLSISNIEQDQKTLSLQDNAAAAEFGLSYQVQFELSKKGLSPEEESDTLIRHTVRIDQSYRHESTALLAKERERLEVQEQLSQRLADEIFRQVSLFDFSSVLVENMSNVAPSSSRHY